MKEYFKPTGKKILGLIILLFLFSFVSFFLQFLANPTVFITGENPIPIGFPVVYFIIGNPNNFNILGLIIDIIIFYLIVCVFGIIFRRKKENVPNSDSGGRDTSPPDQAQPQH